MIKVSRILAIALLLSSGAYAASRPDLRFSKRTDLPNSGIRLGLMPKAVAAPLAPPAALTYTSRDSSGRELGKEERYSPYELWQRDQQAGMWNDAFGNVLSLGIIKYPFPAFDQKHVPQKDYLAKANELINSQKTWSIQDVTAWAKAYLQNSNITATEESKRPFKFSKLVKFQFKSNSGHQFAYAFILNSSASGQRMASDNWYFVYIQANKEVDPKRAIRAVETDFIKSVGVPPMSAKHKVAASSSFKSTSSSSLSKKTSKSNEYAESRKIVKQSIANLKAWWYVETKSFILLSNLKSTHKATIKVLQRNIEQIRGGFELLLPPAKPITAVSVVRIPGTSNEYATYVGAKYGWSGGLWMSSRRELVIRASDGGSSKFKKEQMLTTAYHEGFHQYLFYAVGQTQVHSWFNEGHACFFEGAVINNSSLKIREEKYKASNVDAMMKSNAFSLQRIIDMPHAQFYAGSDENRANNYGSAWLVVYYLRKHAAFDKKSPYRSICDRYYAEVIATRDRDAANKKAFEGIDMAKLEADIIAFWNSRNMRVKAKSNSIFRNYRPSSRR